MPFSLGDLELVYFAKRDYFRLGQAIRFIVMPL